MMISEDDIRDLVRSSLIKEIGFKKKLKLGRGGSSGGSGRESSSSSSNISGEAANFGPSSSVESSVSERANRLGKELGIDPAWIYAEEAKESAHNPKAMAWNLHIAVKDKWARKAGVRPLTREQKQKFKDAGFPVGQTKSYYGEDAKKAFQAAFEISPAHAIIGGAWGLYQVLGAFSLPQYSSDPARWRSEFESNPVRHSEKAFKKWIQDYGEDFKRAVNRGDYAYTTAKYYGAPNAAYQNFIAKHVQKFRRGQERPSDDTHVA